MRVDAPTEDITNGVLEVPISALEHYSYCPRQCALIHVEHAGPVLAGRTAQR